MVILDVMVLLRSPIRGYFTQTDQVKKIRQELDVELFFFDGAYVTWVTANNFFGTICIKTELSPYTTASACLLIGKRYLCSHPSMRMQVSLNPIRSPQ